MRSITAAVYYASSRVGDKIRAQVPAGLYFYYLMIKSIIGKTKAPVFPDPVTACTKRSRLYNAIGITVA